MRQRIKTVLDWAKASGFRGGDNPVDGITKVLPKHKGTAQHHAALPYEQVPEDVVARINAKVRGWVNYFAMGDAGESFSHVRYWIEMRMRRHLLRTQQCEDLSRDQRWRARLYDDLGLFRDYRLRHHVAPSGRPGESRDVRTQRLDSIGGEPVEEQFEAEQPTALSRSVGPQRHPTCRAPHRVVRAARAVGSYLASMKTDSNTSLNIAALGPATRRSDTYRRKPWTKSS